MIDEVAGGVELSLHIQPRASRTELVGVHGTAIKLRLAAPPVDGEANEELIRFLAKLLGVTKTAVTIRSGETGKRKRVRIDGMDLAKVTKLLGL